MNPKFQEYGNVISAHVLPDGSTMVEYSDEKICWFDKNGEKFRVMLPNGTDIWRSEKFGFHCLSGPSIRWASGRRDYHFFGHKFVTRFRRRREI